MSSMRSMSDTDMCGCKNVNVINSLDNDTSRTTEHNVRESARAAVYSVQCTVQYRCSSAVHFTCTLQLTPSHRW